MGIKRPHHHDDSMPETMSRRKPDHPSKRPKSNEFAPPSTKSASVNQLKSKIRDLTRALEHSDHLPVGVRIEKERALAGYKQDVEKILDGKRRKEFIKKYHMVRFFGRSFLALAQLHSIGGNTLLNISMCEERQKATRALKKLQKRLDASPPDTSDYTQLAKEVHDANIDVNYTIYYPLTEKYQSLFPRQGGDSGGEKTPARKLVTEKPAMWDVVERCTADGTLDALRDGKLATSIVTGNRKHQPGKARSKRQSKKDRAGSKAAKGAVAQERHDESDGGFFEE